MKYKWTVEGTAARMIGDGAEGQTWTTTGEIETGALEFHNALTQVMRQSFQQLTKGNAIFGQPGVGCRGPYAITRYALEAVVQ
jgi:hypothetical protein